ncbi:coiled-coil domain-containing protein 107 [Rhinophrynus dorsalis]
MALSFSQQVMLSVVIALFVCIFMPRIFGGGGKQQVTKPEHRRIPPLHGRPYSESKGKTNAPAGGTEKKAFPNAQDLRNAVEQEIKSDKMSGSSRGLAFTFMPLYAIGVAIFAAFKFKKINTKEKSQTENDSSEQKTKETEIQLQELERHLSQTEDMLHSLLTQLDPLSGCINTLANEQRSEIMHQLQSIRELMKENGMNKSTFHKTANQTCQDTLEDLIYSLKKQNVQIGEADEDGKESEEQLSDLDDTDRTKSGPVIEEEYNAIVNSLEAEDSDYMDESEVPSNNKTEGLRKRNVKD